MTGVTINLKGRPETPGNGGGVQMYPHRASLCTVGPIQGQNFSTMCENHGLCSGVS